MDGCRDIDRYDLYIASQYALFCFVMENRIG